MQCRLRTEGYEIRCLDGDDSRLVSDIGQRLDAGCRGDNCRCHFFDDFEDRFGHGFRSGNGRSGCRRCRLSDSLFEERIVVGGDVFEVGFGSGGRDRCHNRGLGGGCGPFGDDLSDFRDLGNFGCLLSRVGVGNHIVQLRDSGGFYLGSGIGGGNLLYGRSRLTIGNFRAFNAAVGFHLLLQTRDFDHRIGCALHLRIERQGLTVMFQGLLAFTLLGVQIGHVGMGLGFFVDLAEQAEAFVEATLRTDDQCQVVDGSLIAWINLRGLLECRFRCGQIVRQEAGITQIIEDLGVGWFQAMGFVEEAFGRLVVGLLGVHDAQSMADLGIGGILLIDPFVHFAGSVDVAFRLGEPGEIILGFDLLRFRSEVAGAGVSTPAQRPGYQCEQHCGRETVTSHDGDPSLFGKRRGIRPRREMILTLITVS